MANPSNKAQNDELGKFGKIVVERKYASLNNVKAVIQKQRQLMLKGKKVRLGDLMVKLKVISTEQKNDVLNLQNAVQLPIPGYEIMEKLGQGGMGAVYLGRQINMDRKVAIKTLNPNLAASKSNVKKFLKEAKSVAQLNHNNIVKGIDVGQNKGRYYFIMEYVDGPTIQKLLDNNGIVDEKKSLSIASQMADAIRYINLSNFVHRDIKPDNIILTSKGIPKLADLGLVLTAEGDESEVQDPLSSKTTGTNTTFVGTPHYISPEQAQEQDVDFRSDIYSLGATLFHMVTGRTPFEGDRSIIIMTKHITEDITAPKEINSVLSKGLNDLILKMMEKDPDDRQQSPEELMQDIETVIETGILPGAITTKKRTKKVRRTLGTSNRRRRKRVKRRPTSTSRKRTKSKRIKSSDQPDAFESSRLEVTTDSFLLSEKDLNDSESPDELLKMAKETNNYKLKEQYLLQAMRDEDDDELSLEAKCRYSYLVSVLKKEEAIEILLEVIEDYIDYSENKYYGLAEKKLKELNNQS